MKKAHLWLTLFIVVAGIAGITYFASQPIPAPPESVIGEMVLIPGGTFWMGCTEGDSRCRGKESPRHRVTISSFYMDKTEVTVGQFRKFIRETGYTTDAERGAGGSVYKGGGEWKQVKGASWSNPRRDGQRSEGNHPVVQVSWNDAKAYCKWARKRLPTEAEWEYAARGGHNDWKYPWGNDISHDDANYDGTGGRDQWKYTSPVGSFPPNDYGLYDMAGNVWEWVEDGWHDDYSSAPTDGRVWLSGSDSDRVLRGGSWDSNPGHLRVSNRVGYLPAFRLGDLGFRCTRTAHKAWPG